MNNLLEKIDIFFQELNKNEKIVVILFPIILYGGFLFYYIFPNINKEHKQIKQEYETIKNNIKTYNNNILNINTQINIKENNIKEYNNKIKQITNTFNKYYILGEKLENINFKQNILIDILKNIIYQSLNYNIKITSISNITEEILKNNIKIELKEIEKKYKKNKTYISDVNLLGNKLKNSKFLKTKAIIKLTVNTNNWKNFIQFIQNIENMSYIQKIKYMSLDKNNYNIILEVYGFNLKDIKENK